MARYIKAEEGAGRSVIYTDDTGKQWKFEAGSRPWRNQNPGNLVPGNVSKRNGAIGVAGGFAVFPDYETGHGALLDSLKTVHGNKDIPSLMKVYAPPAENQTTKYIAFIRQKTGIRGNKKVRDFSPAEFEKLWQAVEKMEGWGKDKEGLVNEHAAKKPVTGIRKNKKGTIKAYQIESYGWVSKAEGIALTRKGFVDAVVATSPKGNRFLRARPNSQTWDNLESKG
jgi:hypothetical protein